LQRPVHSYRWSRRYLTGKKMPSVEKLLKRVWDGVKAHWLVRAEKHSTRGRA
jgi:hypothetical protein